MHSMRCDLKIKVRDMRNINLAIHAMVAIALDSSLQFEREEVTTVREGQVRSCLSFTEEL